MKSLQKELEEIKIQNIKQENENKQEKDKNRELSKNELNSITSDLKTSKMEIERLRKELDAQIILVASATVSGNIENTEMVTKIGICSHEIEELKSNRNEIQKVSKIIII